MFNNMINIDNYKLQLEKLLGDKKRVTVRLIHDNRELCFNSGEREIIYSIAKLRPDLDWHISEKYYILALTVMVNDLEDQELNLKEDKFNPIYMECFDVRIKQITDKYDRKYMNKERREEYNKLKEEYNEFKNIGICNIDKYKEFRDKFDKIRNN